MIKKSGRWFKNNKWILIGLIWIAAFSLGYIGFSKYYANIGEIRSQWYTLYVTIQLFVLESGAVSGPLGWELQIARILAPLIAAYTVIQAMAIILREQILLFRLRFLKEHIVICGLGQKGLLLCQTFRQIGERVVIIELDKDNEFISSCKEYGATVLIDNATNMFALNRARVNKAKYIISVCGDDAANVEVAVRSRELALQRKGDALSCLVHILNPKLCDLIREKEISMGVLDTFRLELFNVFESGARTLLTEYPPFIETDSEYESTPHIVVVGAGHMGESLIINAAKKWWDLQKKNGKRLRITLVDSNSESKRECLCFHYPHLDTACEILTYQIDVDDIAFDRSDFLFNQLGHCNVKIIYISFDDDSKALRAALTLHQRLINYEIPIVIGMNSDSNLAVLLEDRKEGNKNFSNIHILNLLDKTCTPDLILGCTYEILARSIHEEYVRNEIKKGSTIETNPTLVSWDDLPETIKESNRHQAGHIRDKLEAIGCNVAITTDWEVHPFEFSPEEIELMAEMEHKRFIEERLSQGFRYGDTKDLEKKISPTLIPWENLPESEKQKDRDVVLGLTTILTKARFQIYRRKTIETNLRYD